MRAEYTLYSGTHNIAEFFSGNPIVSVLLRTFEFRVVFDFRLCGNKTLKMKQLENWMSERV